MSKPFRPNDGGTVTVAASTTSADEAIDPNSHAIAIFNNCADGVAHIKTAKGGGTLTATTADFPVGPKQHAIIGIPSTHDTVAVILSSGATSANVYITPGTGGHLR